MRKLIKTILILLLLTGVPSVHSQAIQMYGLTPSGGTYGGGTLFKINNDGSGFEVKFNFDSLSGFEAWGSLIQARNGLLYGLTCQGGPSKRGVIFSYNPLTNVYSDCYDFDSLSGGNCYNKLLEASDGKLYGMTGSGGTYNFGYIYSYDPSTNVFTQLYQFDGLPFGRSNKTLAEATTGQFSGKLIGSVYNISCSNSTLFSFDISNLTFTELGNFCAEGGNPNTPVIFDSVGSIYGSTSNGSMGFGSLFKYNSTLGLVVFEEFISTAVGTRPAGPPVLINNILYTILNQSSSLYGSIIGYDLTTGYDSLRFLLQDSLGKWPSSAFTLMSDGKLYGTIWSGGRYLAGVVYSFDYNNNNYTKLFDFDGPSGANPGGELLEVDTALFYLSTGNESQSFNYTLYPNPTSATLNLNCQGNTEITQAKIYSPDGKIIDIIPMSGNRNSIDIRNLKEGIYFIQLLTANSTSVIKRFIVMK